MPVVQQPTHHLPPLVLHDHEALDWNDGYLMPVAGDGFEKARGGCLMAAVDMNSEKAGVDMKLVGRTGT